MDDYVRYDKSGVRTYYPRIPLEQDLDLYPYTPITKPEQVETLLQLATGYPKNPLVPLPPRPPLVPEERATIQLTKELRPPIINNPLIYKAVIKSSPKELNLPVDKAIAIEIYDLNAFESHPIIRAHNLMLHTIACYMKLEELQGDLIPQYYGTFTMVVPYYGEFAVVVREHIDGDGMDDMKRMECYSIQERQSIMRKVIDLDGEIQKRGVSLAHGMLPSAFIVNKEKDEFRVVAWMLTFSCLDPTGDWRYTTPGLLPSALLRWKEDSLLRYRLDRFVNWSWVPWLFKEYGHELSSITEEQKNRVGGLDHCPIPYGNDEENAGVGKKRKLNDGVTDSSKRDERVISNY